MLRGPTFTRPFPRHGPPSARARGGAAAARRAPVVTALAAIALLLGAAGAAAAPVERSWYWPAPWAPAVSGPTVCAGLARGLDGRAYVVSGWWADGVERYHLACVTPDGVTAWEVQEAGPGDAGVWPAAAASDRSGAVLVAGRYSGSSEDGYVRKVDAAGRFRWYRTWDSGRSDEFVAVACDPDGNVYAAGSTEANAGDLVLVKYSRGGRRLWTRRYSTAREDNAVAVASDGRGNVYVAGTVAAEKGGESRLLVASYAPDGSRRWARQVGGVGMAYTAVGLAVRGSNVYALGQAWLESGVRPILAKYTLAGRRVWAHGYWPTLSQVTAGPVVAADGSIGLAGDAWEAVVPPTFIGTAAVVVVAPDGNPWTSASDTEWSGRGLPEAWPASARALAAGPDGRWYVAGAEALDAEGRENDGAVFGWPSPGSGDWEPDMVWRLHGTHGDSACTTLLRMGGAMWVGGQLSEGTTSHTAVQRIELQVP